MSEVPGTFFNYPEVIVALVGAAAVGYLIVGVWMLITDKLARDYVLRRRCRISDSRDMDVDDR